MQAKKNDAIRAKVRQVTNVSRSLRFFLARQCGRALMSYVLPVLFLFLSPFNGISYSLWLNLKLRFE